MQKEKLSSPVEELTISWKKRSDTSADLILEWETTRLTVPVQAK